jgi:hypothetical protein
MGVCGVLYRGPLERSMGVVLRAKRPCCEAEAELYYGSDSHLERIDLVKDDFEVFVSPPLLERGLERLAIR